MPRVSGFNNQDLSSADPDVVKYVQILENNLISAWAASGIEEHYSALFDDLAQRTVLKKPGNVYYKNAEKKLFIFKDLFCQHFVFLMKNRLM
jgi:hypothetical protein